MKNKLFLLVFLGMALFLASPALQAQEAVERSKNITKIGGKEYYMHQVKQGQTLWGISQVYNVTVEEIEKLNPDVKDGLKAGHVLGIPVRPVKAPQVEPTETPKIEPQEEPKVEPQEEPKVVPQIVPQEKPKDEPFVVHKEPYSTSGRVVRTGEDLYDIAKEFGIDISDFKFSNPGLTDEPAPGTVIQIPAIANENDYIVHYCERNERVTSLLKRWKVDENAFRTKNVSVGSHVFENQVVLIPIQPITDFYWMQQAKDEVVEEVDEEEDELLQPEEKPQFNFEELGEVPTCVASAENARRTYNVALMVPLYLNNIGGIDASKANASKSQRSRAMKFLQFYEGFMLATEALEKQGLKLDLTVLDVTDNVASAEKALEDIRDKELDLIVGPFFGNSFEVIEEYAKSNGIVVVNPLSNRESVIEDNPNVVKAKAGTMGMILSISSLVKNRYPNANVFIVSREKASDSLFLTQLEHHLNRAVDDQVTVSGDEFLQFARNESERMEMGSRIVPTLEVEGQVYSTDDFQNGGTDKVVLDNPVKRYSYSEMGKVKSQLSGVRPNVIVAYGNDNVFATQMLNTLTRTADRFPITLVCAPDWSKNEKLLVDNLLKMNAIYVSDFFVDYNDDAVKRFVLRFRQKYVAEPQKYAFEGYDIGYYFLNALMQYGSDDLMGCLHCYEDGLLHTHYRFYYKNYLRSGWDDGKENLYWSLYQYDKSNVELVPINPFKKSDDE